MRGPNRGAPMPAFSSRTQTRPRWPRNGSSSSSIRSSAGAEHARRALARAGPGLAGQRPRDHVRDVVVADRHRVGVAERRPGPPRPPSTPRCPGSRSAGAVASAASAHASSAGGGGGGPAQRVGPLLLDAERWNTQYGVAATACRVGRQQQPRPAGPGPARAGEVAHGRRVRAVRLLAGHLLLEDARTRRWKTRPVAGRRRPVWPAGQLGHHRVAGRRPRRSRSGRRAGRPWRRPGPRTHSAPGP